jgi:hypothetical protein
MPLSFSKSFILSLDFIPGTMDECGQYARLLHRKSDGVTRKKIPGCNSDKKLISGKKKVATLSLKITVLLIL